MALRYDFGNDYFLNRLHFNNLIEGRFSWFENDPILVMLIKLT